MWSTRQPYRIRASSDIKRIFKLGKRVHSSIFQLIYAPNRVSYSRYGVIVGKKLGKSVKRNRIKRLYREILRQQILYLTQGVDLLIVPKVTTQDKNFQSTREMIHKTLLKEHLLKMPNLS